MRVALIVVTVSIATAGLILAQSEPRQDQGAVFRTETSLALVRFHVVRGGKFVTDLHPDDVRVEEDGLPRRAAFLEGGADRKTPLDVILLFDCTGSMRHGDVLKPLAFKSGLLDSFEHVRLSIYGFSEHDLLRATPPTRDLAQLSNAMNKVTRFGGGSTHLYESISGALADVAEQGGASTRMMVIFSDALSAAADRDEAIRAAKDQDISLYPVLKESSDQDWALFLGNIDGYKRRERMDETLTNFTGLGAPTGGQSIAIQKGEKDMLEDILATLFEIVRSEYVVGVYPPQSKGEKRRHELRVALRPGFAGEIRGGSLAVRH